MRSSARVSLVRFLSRLRGYTPWRRAQLKRLGRKFVQNYSKSGSAQLVVWPCEGDADDDPVLVYDRHFEYAYVIEVIRRYRLDGLTILDIGSAGSVLPTVLAAMGNKVICLDMRNWPVEYKGVEILRGEVSTADIPEGSCDVITCVSALEHFGLGRYGDRHDVDGDFKGLARIRTWLKTEGVLILTLPYGRPTVAYPAHRVYDESRLARLTEGLTVLDRRFYGPIDDIRVFRPCSERDTHTVDPSSAYGIVCCVLQR